jgi:transcriptional regulator with XRE-family HTH domain
MLGKYLKKLRADLDMSLADVEKESGVTSGYIGKLEREEVKKPSTKILGKLAKVYSVNVLTLLKKGNLLIDDKIHGEQEEPEIDDEEAEELIKFLKSDGNCVDLVQSYIKLMPSQKFVLVEFAEFLVSKNDARDTSI